MSLAESLAQYIIQRADALDTLVRAWLPSWVPTFCTAVASGLSRVQQQLAPYLEACRRVGVFLWYGWSWYCLMSVVVGTVWMARVVGEIAHYVALRSWAGGRWLWERRRAYGALLLSTILITVLLEKGHAVATDRVAAAAAAAAAAAGGAPGPLVGRAVTWLCQLAAPGLSWAAYLNSWLAAIMLTPAALPWYILRATYLNAGWWIAPVLEWLPAFRQVALHTIKAIEVVLDLILADVLRLCEFLHIHLFMTAWRLVCNAACGAFYTTLVLIDWMVIAGAGGITLAWNAFAAAVSAVGTAVQLLLSLASLGGGGGGGGEEPGGGTITIHA